MKINIFLLFSKFLKIKTHFLENKNIKNYLKVFSYKFFILNKNENKKQLKRKQHGKLNSTFLCFLSSCGAGTMKKRK